MSTIEGTDIEHSIVGITSAPSTQRAQELLVPPVVVTPQYAGAVDIMTSAQLAAVGVLTGATVVQGVAINGGADIAGMIWHALPGSVGTGVLTDLASVTDAFNFGNWTQTAFTGAFGTATLRAYSHLFSELCLSFQTNARTIGFAGGLGAVPMSVELWIDEQDGFGYKRVTQKPFPQTNAFGGTVYYDFGSSVDRRFIVMLGNFLYGLCVRASDVISPINMRQNTMTFGVLVDSVYPASIAAIRSMRSFAVALNGAGGTGYVVPNHNGMATANSNLNLATEGVISSVSGNIGWGGANPGNDQPTTQDGHVLVENELAPVPGALGITGAHTTSIIGANPDVVLLAIGINDYTEAQKNLGFAFGWSMISAIDAVLTRLREGLPQALLIVLSPWGSSNGGVSGYDSINDNFTAIPNGLTNIQGPWLFISTVARGNGVYANQWRGKRKNGTLFGGDNDFVPWLTGTGNVNAPAGNGNADNVLQDSVHPTNFGSTTVTVAQTINQVGATLQVSSTTLGFRPTGTFSLQPAASPQLAYPGITVTYTGKTANSFTGCTRASGSGVAGIGDKCYMLDETGADYYGRKVAECIISAVQNF